MKTYNIELPAEFRSGNGVSVEKATITRARMEEILVNAIEADRKRGGEPSSLAEVWRINADEAEAYGQPDRADTLRECAAEVERLAAPQPAEPVDKSKNLQGSVVDKAEEMQGQPAEPRLDAPAQVGHTRFGEGVPWSTVIGAAQRYHAAQNTPAKEKERLQRAAENIKALHQAEPVKAPSDADAKHVQDFINCDGMGAMIVEGPQYSAVVRALLARYGNNPGAAHE